MSAAPSAAEIEALVGHEFPGGTYTIAHWENFLLTECTGSEPDEAQYHGELVDFDPIWQWPKPVRLTPRSVGGENGCTMRPAPRGGAGEMEP